MKISLSADGSGGPVPRIDDGGIGKGKKARADGVEQLGVVASVEVCASYSPIGKEGVTGKEHALGSAVERDASARMSRRVEALQFQGAAANDVAVVQRVPDDRRRARIGNAKGAHLVGIVLGPPGITLVRLAAQIAKRFGKRHAEDMVEVKVSAEDMTHRQPFGCQEACQHLLLARPVARRVDEDSLTPFVPHHIGVRGQHIELKELQIHLP